MLDPNNAFKNRNLPRFQPRDPRDTPGKITVKQSSTLRRLMGEHKIWWVTLCRAEFGTIKPMNKLTEHEASRCVKTANIWAHSPKGGPYDDKKGKHL
jgi:hypothetical protein